MTTIRALRAVLLTVLVMCCARSSPAAELPSQAPAVTIRIHDYARLPSDVVARAQRFVDGIFRDIGVRTEWGETLRPDALSDGLSLRARGPSDLLLIILNPAMARRRAFAPDVIGTAAVTIHDGGRVGYILGDRLLQVAGYSERDLENLMGLVMAHELAHLLLPFGSHTPVGLMRPRWRMQELQSVRNRDRFRLTPVQADEIREMLLARGG